MRIVTVLGNTNSGAGAIYEYLIGRKDTHDPFNKKEFRILNDPGGINDLYRSFDCYSLQSFNERLESLINLEKHYRPNRSLFSEGLGLNQVRNYNTFWLEYIKNIKGKEFNHRYIYSDVKRSFYVQISKKILNRFGIRKFLFRKYQTGITKRKFRDYTYEFLMKIIDNNSNKELLSVLNQCGNFANPLSSTELLGEPKIICVRRNPLDQFAELKLHKGMHNPKEFVNWYLHLKKMESRSEFKDDKILELNFEDFVLDFKNKSTEICNFLNISDEIDSLYNPILSKYNIGKYKEILNNNEISILKNSLSDCTNIDF